MKRCTSDTPGQLYSNLGGPPLDDRTFAWSAKRRPAKEGGRWVDGWALRGSAEVGPLWGCLPPPWAEVWHLRQMRGGVASERQAEWTEAWVMTDWANDPRPKATGPKADGFSDDRLGK